MKNFLNKVYIFYGINKQFYENVFALPQMAIEHLISHKYEEITTKSWFNTHKNILI